MMRPMKKSFRFGFVGGLALLMIAAIFPGPLREAQAAEAGGTIQGTVASPWVGRYPALVYVDQVKGEFPPPKQDPHMSQKGLVFRPHILPVLKGTTVDFTNDDTVSHNVFAPPGSATTFNLGVYAFGVTKTETFHKLGVVPLLCVIHPEMSAYVIVVQNPYFSLTDKQGAFAIKDVPPGTYRLKTWDERLKEASQEVTVEAGKTTAVEFKGLTKR